MSGDKLPRVNPELTRARASSHFETKISLATQSGVVETARGANAMERIADETRRAADAQETVAMVEYLKILGDLLSRGLVSEERVLEFEKKLAERFEGVLG